MTTVFHSRPIQIISMAEMAKSFNEISQHTKMFNFCILHYSKNQINLILSFFRSKTSPMQIAMFLYLQLNTPRVLFLLNLWIEPVFPFQMQSRGAQRENSYLKHVHEVTLFQKALVPLLTKRMKKMKMRCGLCRRRRSPPRRQHLNSF